MKQGVKKKGVIKSVLSIILTAILVLGLIPSVPVKLVVHAEGEQGEENTVQVTYVDENKTVQTVDAILFTSDLCIPDPDFPGDLQFAPKSYFLGNPDKTTYYYVGEDIEVSESIELEGDIVLILGDGVTFNDVSHFECTYIADYGFEYTVSIYGQQKNNGKMILDNLHQVSFGCNCEIYGGVISFVHLSGWNILLNDGKYYYLDGNGQKIVIEGIKDMTEEEIIAFFNEKTIYPIYPNFYINIEETQNGTVTVEDEVVSSGTKVTPTITPADGYALDSYTVIDADGESVEVAEDYSFTMPEKNVTISASFAEPAENPVISDQKKELRKEYGYASDAFTIDVEEAEGHEYSYQWYINTTDSNEGGLPIEGETNSSLTIEEGKGAGIEEYYYCEITATRTGTSQTAQTVSGVCTLTIDKADKPDNAPSASQKVAYKNAKIGDVELPVGWQWKSNDKQLALIIGKFTNATAEYVAEDKDNYKTTTVSIDVSRLACNHTNTELRNFKAATTTEKGYTGDTYCKDCGKIISLGQEKNKLPSSSGSETKADGSDKNTQYKNEWVNGKWYNEVGVCDYEGTLTWKSDSTGWWVEDTAGWYPQSQWQKIDGEWYYFKASGYMASGEYFNGYWFNSDGTMDDTYYLTWKSDSTGWWVEDKSGWWPSSQWLQIDGYWYYFNGSGYMVTNQYVDGYWLGSDGACQ